MSIYSNPQYKTGFTTASGAVCTPAARASFPYLLAPQEPNAKNGLKEPKYGVTLLFGAEADFKLLQNLAHAALVEKFGKDYAEKYPVLRSPFRDQGEKAFDGYVRGLKFITATSGPDYPPGVVDLQGRPIDRETAHKVYAGVWLRATVTAYAYDNKSKGVAFGLNNVQLIRDDEKLGGGGRVDPSQEFGPPETASADSGSGARSMFDS